MGQNICKYQRLFPILWGQVASELAERVLHHPSSGTQKTAKKTPGAAKTKFLLALKETSALDHVKEDTFHAAVVMEKGPDVKQTYFSEKHCLLWCKERVLSLVYVPAGL